MIPEKGCGTLGAVCNLGQREGRGMLGVGVSRHLSSTLPKDVTPDSEKDINRLSTFPFPPCVGSILRRQREDRCMPYKR